MLRTIPRHYLRPNHREASPHRVLVFDTETVPIHAGDVIEQRLALWCSRLTIRHGREGKHARQQDNAGTTADELADVAEAASRSAETLWVFAHNLSFDLAVTRLPLLMLARGWSLTQHALASDAPWCRMVKGGKRITIVNSASYLPASVAALGAAIGVRKPALPSPDDAPGMLARCQADVEITSRAIIALMDWWDEHALGNWSLTGPACGWGAYRHMPTGMNVLIDPNPEAVAFERKALLAGRREAWRVGTLPEGYYLDLDIEHAHLTACAEMPLPYQRMRSFDALPLDSPWLRLESLDVMAEAIIVTHTPRYPVMLKHGLFYPIGRFRTVLAGPELREALARGELESIGHGYLYRVARHMARWGRWLADEMTAERDGDARVVPFALKGWSRSVPGRWAGRTSELLTEYADTRPGWWLEHGTWGLERWPVSYLTIGGRQLVIRRDIEGDNSFPAVLAWVQSYTRVWLGRLVDHAGHAMVQCNTDGAVVDAARLRGTDQVHTRSASVRASTAERQLASTLAAINAAIAPARIRVKRTARTVTVLGAQHVRLDNERRYSGIPAEATEISDLRFRYWSWPGLAGQIANGETRGFRQHRIDADLSRIPVNRWITARRQALPPALLLDSAGNNAVVPFALTYGPRSRLDPERQQHPDLQAAQTAPTVTADDLRQLDPRYAAILSA